MTGATGIELYCPPQAKVKCSANAAAVLLTHVPVVSPGMTSENVVHAAAGSVNGSTSDLLLAAFRNATEYVPAVVLYASNLRTDWEAPAPP
jgi:protein tyrosine phosphatase (PTP) superfamily phosphohydrolase (DUF442 family)